jgi:uncharacterized membrane protein
MNADTLSLSSQALDMRMASALGLLSPLRAQWCSGDHQQRLGLSSEHAVAVVKKFTQMVAEPRSSKQQLTRMVQTPCSIDTQGYCADHIDILGLF